MQGSESDYLRENYYSYRRVNSKLIKKKNEQSSNSLQNSAIKIQKKQYQREVASGKL